MYPVLVVGERVGLRELRPDDIDQAHALVGDDRVTRWLSFDSRSRAEAEKMIAGVVERATLDPRTEYYLAVSLNSAPDKLIGFVRLGLTGVRAAKLGGAVLADYWGAGYATDAARMIVDFGFTQIGLHRISAAIGPDNAASISVVEKLGFSYEGRIRHHVYTNGAWRDSVLYSLLSPEQIAKTSVNSLGVGGEAAGL